MHFFCKSNPVQFMYFNEQKTTLRSSQLSCHIFLVISCWQYIALPQALPSQRGTLGYTSRELEKW